MNLPVPLRLRLMTVEDGPGILRIEQASYPQLDPDDLLQPGEIGPHIELFPEGAFVVEDIAAGLVVGMAFGWRMDFDLDQPQHTLEDVYGPENHDPNGDWYYGLDISVDPAHRGRGIGRALYDERKALVRRLGLRGIVAGGMLPGLGASGLDAATYVEEVISGSRRDPTLSFQRANGFEVRGLLPGYVRGGAHGGVASLLVWESGM